MNNKKITVLLTALLIVALALPAFAQSGTVTSKVEMETSDADGADDPQITLTLADGSMDLATIEDVSLSVSFLEEYLMNDGYNADADGVNTLALSSDFEYTGVENLTLGVEGEAPEDDAYMIVKKGDADVDLGFDFYGNYSMEAAEGLTVGSDNSLAMTKDGDADMVNTLTIDPNAKYEMEVYEGMTAGAEADVEYVNELSNDSDDYEATTTLTAKPYFNVDTEVAEDVTLTADNSLEYVNELSNDADTYEPTTTLEVTPKVEYAKNNVRLGVMGAGFEFSDVVSADDYDSDQMLVHAMSDGESTTLFALKPYAEMDLELGEGTLTAGGEFNYRTMSTSVNEDLEFTNTVIKPYANYEMALSDNLKVISENSYEITTTELNDTKLTDGVGVLTVMGGVEYSF